MTVYNPSQKIRVWRVWYYSNAGTWTDDGYFPRGGKDEFIDVFGSTSQTIILADGSQAHTAPEHYSTREKLTLTIPSEQLTTAYKSKIKSYIASGAGIRIRTHEADDVYIEGYPQSLRDTWRLSGNKQKHLFHLEIQVFDVDASGSI